MRVLVGILVAFLGSAAAAGSLETAPTTIELSPASAAGVLHVVNRSDHPVAFQVEAFDWTQPGGADRLDPSATLQVSPPIAELAPGQKQTIRLRAQGGSGSQERAFRLLISELPSPSEEPGQVQVLLQFSVPVFTSPVQRGQPALDWRATRDGADLVLLAANAGPRRAKFSMLSVVGKTGTQRVPDGQLVYVLAGGARQWRLSGQAHPPGGEITVQAHDAAGNALRVSLNTKD